MKIDIHFFPVPDGYPATTDFGTAMDSWRHWRRNLHTKGKESKMDSIADELAKAVYNNLQSNWKDWHPAITPQEVLYAEPSTISYQNIVNGIYLHACYGAIRTPSAERPLKGYFIDMIQVPDEDISAISFALINYKNHMNGELIREKEEHLRSKYGEFIEENN